MRTETSPTFSLVKKEDLYHFLEEAQQDEVEAEVNLRSWTRDFISEGGQA
ncbi:hypothetical protein N836_09850 [Leptolyngbya sp. Heron Island J]|nr:hypothetical protein N836_09850 [Leptolyngbya sp. Heron Island J]